MLNLKAFWPALFASASCLTFANANDCPNALMGDFGDAVHEAHHTLAWVREGDSPPALDGVDRIIRKNVLREAAVSLEKGLQYPITRKAWLMVRLERARQLRQLGTFWNDSGFFSLANEELDLVETTLTLIPEEKASIDDERQLIHKSQHPKSPPFLWPPQNPSDPIIRS